MPQKKARTKDRAVRTAEIEAAAKGVFFQKGFLTATVQEIADRANVSKGTIYLYYKGKDDLCVSLMMPSLEELGRLLEKFEKELDAGRYRNSGEFMMGFCATLMRYYEYDPDGIRIYQGFQLGNLFSVLSKETLKLLNRTGKRNFAIARRLFSKASDLGFLPKLDAIKTVDAVWAMFLGVVQIEENKLRWTKKNHLADTLEYGLRVFLLGLEKQPKARAPKIA